jgi:uncharacterized protein involved in response to NO
MSASPELAATRARGEAGWLFAASFRPFFIGASILAAAAVPAWVWMYFTGADEIAGMPAMAWHAHEMVFGYLPAVMAGYLLSSTPNWSGRLPASGIPLAVLFAIWLAGRAVPLVVPAPVGLVADAAFPIAVAAVLLREAFFKAPKQSRHGLMLFPLLAVASIAHRTLAGDPEWASLLARAGVGVAALMIAAVGGRLVPSLTRNALANRGADRVPEPYGRFDVGVLMAASLGLIAWILAPSHPATAVLAIGAGVLHVVRLARWRGWLLRDGGVIALHAGYGWLAAGTIMIGLSADPLSLLPPDAALHALSAGAIGAMTLAVMTRLATTRGAGSRTSGAASGIALIAVNAGALLRVIAPMAADWHPTLLVIGAILWSGGFAIFALAQVWTAVLDRKRPTGPQEMV